MAMQVIGTGFGRTGTDSMRVALDMLGVGPCHHMRALSDDPAQMRAWVVAARSGVFDWDVLLGGYRSCVDWPSALYWPELVRRYPEAKVLLTWRPAEKWWASFERTLRPIIARRIEEMAEAPYQSMAPYIAREVFGGFRVPTREEAIAAYEANVARVRAEVPAERLLVHEPGDGWEPLCAHLGVPVPGEPFPHVNSAKEFLAPGGLGGNAAAD